MPTWLLAWNPRQWEWTDLNERVQEVKTRGISRFRWSCGRTKKIQKSERVFLIKLGPEPRGLIGSGWTESRVRQEDHWDANRQQAGQSALYIDVCWDTLVVEPLISRAHLNDAPFNTIHWDTQSSGISLPPHIAQALEAAWQKQTGFEHATLPLAFTENAMALPTPHIDPYLFACQFAAFRTFVEEQSHMPFVSFASHPYTEKQEGYKSKLYGAARDALALQAWKPSAIGSGEILAATIAAIELPENNLVPWQGRFGKAARPHQPLYEAQSERSKVQPTESCLFTLYHEPADAASFAALVGIFGKTYPLIAYLLFLKDRSKYLPIAPTFFDKAFAYLGAAFKTTQRCSWENYTAYVGLIDELKVMLAETLATEVTLLDAHSFAWILASQMDKQGKLADVQEYLNLSATEREAIVKARIGQGRFRESLLRYWTTCAVTGCTEVALLRASHMKPWSRASLRERLSLYNGLLLSPTLDACFDAGLVSFDDAGQILLSHRLSQQDAKALGLSPTMRLQRIAPEHKTYLAYHREHIYK